jgi:hypothetical protein
MSRHSDSSSKRSSSSASGGRSRSARSACSARTASRDRARTPRWARVAPLAAQLLARLRLHAEMLQRQRIQAVLALARIEHVRRDHRVERDAAQRHALPPQPQQVLLQVVPDLLDRASSSSSTSGACADRRSGGRFCRAACHAGRPAPACPAAGAAAAGTTRARLRRHADAHDVAAQRIGRRPLDTQPNRPAAARAAPRGSPASGCPQLVRRVQPRCRRLRPPRSRGPACGTPARGTRRAAARGPAPARAARPGPARPAARPGSSPALRQPDVVRRRDQRLARPLVRHPSACARISPPSRTARSAGSPSSGRCPSRPGCCPTSRRSAPGSRPRAAAARPAARPRCPGRPTPPPRPHCRRDPDSAGRCGRRSAGRSPCRPTRSPPPAPRHRRFASVPITSSASWSGSAITGTRNPSITSRIFGSDHSRSVGILSRVALYAG